MKKVKLAVVAVILVLFAVVILLMMANQEAFMNYEMKDDGTYDCYEVYTKKRFSNEVTIPSEYKGVKVTSFGCNNYNGRITAEGVKTVIFSEGIERVNIGGLGGSVEKIILPSTIKYISGSIRSEIEIVFENNEYMELVSGCFIEKATKTVTGAFNNAEIPDGVEVIGAKAFCLLNLETIKIPNSVKVIDEYAFYGVSINHPIDLILSSNIEFVGECAFDAPITINKLTISTSAPLHWRMMGEDADSATINNIVLDVKPFVACGNLDNYERNYEQQFTIDAKNLDTLKYLYINNNVAIEDPIMFGEVESDMDGYKKYDYDKYQNEGGYTIITYSVSASGY